MLSDDLRTLRGYLARFLASGHDIPPSRVAALIDYVTPLIEDATSLEQSVADSPDGGRRFSPYELALLEQRSRRILRERLQVIEGEGP